MSHSTAVAYTISSALAWLIACGIWLQAFFWWATNGPDAAVQSAVAGIIGAVPFGISWVLAAKFHADSVNPRAGVHWASTCKGA